MQAARKVKAKDRDAVLQAIRSGKSVIQIARELDLDARSVNGIVSMTRQHRALPPPPPMPTVQERLKALHKAWKESEPDSEYSMRTAAGEKVYIAAYKKHGIVLRAGARKNPVLLTPDMASHIGMKISEFANWTRIPF
jgi:transposase-like protein